MPRWIASYSVDEISTIRAPILEIGRTKLLQYLCTVWLCWLLVVNIALVRVVDRVDDESGLFLPRTKYLSKYQQGFLRPEVRD